MLYLILGIGCIFRMVWTWILNAVFYKVFFAFEPRVHLQYDTEMNSKPSILQGFLWFWALGAFSKWCENELKIMILTRFLLLSMPANRTKNMLVTMFYLILGIGCIFRMVWTWIRNAVFYKIFFAFEPRVHLQNDTEMDVKPSILPGFLWFRALGAFSKWCKN